MTEVATTIPQDRKYSATHQWARSEADGSISVGITDHAQEQLGDLIFIDPPAIGSVVRQDEPCGVVESVKSASEIYAPVSGRVLEANPELADAPEKINEHAYDAWIFRLAPSDPAELGALMDAAEYGKLADS